MSILDKITNDKAKHFIAGAAVAALSAIAWFLASQFGLVPPAGMMGAAVLGAGVAGATKEAADREENAIHPGMHSVEIADALATLAGSAPVVLVLHLLLKLGGSI